MTSGYIVGGGYPSNYNNLTYLNHNISSTGGFAHSGNYHD